MGLTTITAHANIKVHANIGAIGAISCIYIRN